MPLRSEKAQPWRGEHPVEAEEDHGAHRAQVQEAGPQGRALAAERQAVDTRQAERDEAGVVQSPPRLPTEMATEVEAGDQQHRQPDGDLPKGHQQRFVAARERHDNRQERKAHVPVAHQHQAVKAREAHGCRAEELVCVEQERRPHPAASCAGAEEQTPHHGAPEQHVRHEP